jgi:hypothetical protein
MSDGTLSNESVAAPVDRMTETYDQTQSGGPVILADVIESGTAAAAADEAPPSKQDAAPPPLNFAELLYEAVHRHWEESMDRLPEQVQDALSFHTGDEMPVLLRKTHRRSASASKADVFITGSFGQHLSGSSMSESPPRASSASQSRFVCLRRLCFAVVEKFSTSCAARRPLFDKPVLC